MVHDERDCSPGLDNWSYSRLKKLCLGPREGDRAWPSSEQLSLLG